MPSDVRLRSAANACRAQNGIRTGSSSPVEATWTQHCWSRSTFIVQVSMNVLTLIRFTRLAIASTGHRVALDQPAAERLHEPRHAEVAHLADVEEVVDQLGPADQRGLRQQPGQRLPQRVVGREPVAVDGHVLP